MADVTCLGILVADVFGRSIDRYPDRGKLMLVSDMQLHTGGCAANTGADLAKIGVKTAVMGKVGPDGFGDFVVQSLSEQGLDCSGIVRDAQVGTSASMVMVHGDGERSFIHFVGANATLTEEDIDWGVIEGSKVLHVAGTFLMPELDKAPTARILQAAQERGIITSLDTCWDDKGRWMNVLAPCLPHLDIFTPSIEEARKCTGEEDPIEVADALHSRGVKLVVLTMGKQGCFVSDVRTDPTTRFFVPTYEKIDAVDACGAGDAFSAGFLAGWVYGYDIVDSARFGIAVSTLCVMKVGATTGIRSKDETLSFINEHGFLEIRTV